MNAPATFDTTRKPIRAIRDLIVACEGMFADMPGMREPEILSRAKSALTELCIMIGEDPVQPVRMPGRDNTSHYPALVVVAFWSALAVACVGIWAAVHALMTGAASC